MTAGGINTKNIQYCDLASGTSKATRIFPTLDAKSETETTAAGWKTGYLKLNTNFADMTYTVDAAGDMRPGYSKDITQATDNLFAVSEITIVPFSDENAERAVKTRSFYLAGDSICEPLTAAYYPREGWGMEISDYFDDNMLVVNLAKGGKSSHTFLNGYDSTGQIVENDCRMDVIDALACKGDYLFISFGHNDRITETSTATKRATSPTADAPENEESYRYNLKRFVEFARERGMTPVLLTSVHQRSFSGEVLAEDGIEEYRTAMVEVGEELGAAVLDVGAKHTAFISRLGAEGCKKYFSIFDKADYPDSLASNTDGTHLSYLGAREVCAMICDEIRDNATLSGLAALIK